MISHWSYALYKQEAEDPEIRYERIRMSAEAETQAITGGLKSNVSLQSCIMYVQGPT